MAGGFKELNGITADVGIEASGDTLQEAFASAAVALGRLLADPGARERTERVRVTGDSLESLLVRFLNEIIFLDETKGFVPSEVDGIHIKDGSLKAVLVGRTVPEGDEGRRGHVKAATYHGLEISTTRDGVTLRVILDV